MRFCKPRIFYKIRSHRPRNFFIPRTHYVDGPGGEMKAAVVVGHTVQAEFETEKEVELEFKIKDLIVRVRKMVSPAITRSHTVEVAHEYVQKIDKGKYGHMRYRVFGYKIRFQQWKRLGNCGVRKIGSGTARVPTRKEGWKFWQTKRP